MQLLDAWSLGWKHKGRVRAVGPGACEKYCTLGLYAHGGISGITRASSDEDACRAVNHFLKSRFPGKTWTSIAILCNPKMGLHRDLMNLKDHMNHAVTLESFSGGRIWVEDENEDAAEKVQMKNQNASSRGNFATYTMSRLRVVFIKSNRIQVTCGLLRPTLPEPSCGCSKVTKMIFLRV